MRDDRSFFVQGSKEIQVDSFYICLVIPVWKRRLTKKIIKYYTPVYTASVTFTITASQDGASQTEGSYSFYDNSTTE